MRSELELLAHIDDFLDGEISKEELIRLVDNLTDLDVQIGHQQMLRGAIQKEAFIHHSQKALSKFKLLKILKVLLLSFGVVGTTIVVTLLLNQQTDDKLINSSNNPVTAVQNPSNLTSEIKDSDTIEQQKLSEEKLIKLHTEKKRISKKGDKKNYAGIWKGKLIQNSQSFDFSLKLIKVDSIHYNCITKIEVGEQYAVMEAKARFVKDVIKFKEYKIQRI